MNEDLLFKRFFIIQRLHFRILQEELEHREIHPGQPPMLMLVGRHEGINQKEIATKLNIRPATVAIMLRRMEKAGLITRRQDESDKRLQRVYLSEKGKDVCEILKRETNRVEQIATDGLSESEKEQLKNLLDRVIDNLKSHTKGWCHE
ncbi:MarR family winged helix-turn-helix transcriptional regulator [Pseudothermotoga sp. U03pept]|uniref:MarR family winged helix-turn-helix transcriptional regulator n=1 Tax=Pseudothermotoga sp. U03pept TaxID=3447012 RepID=UPI003F0B0A04